MSYSIIYSSKTGNTRMLAETIRESLPETECLYYGEADQAALEADRLYIGFWTDKGSCSRELAEFLQGVKDKEVFLFGTAGFGGAQIYFDQILKRVCQNLDSSNKLTGTYMCQGKMPAAVRERYVKMLESPDHAPNLESMIANFDKAMSHPDKEDLDGLRGCIAAVRTTR